VLGARTKVQAKAKLDQIFRWPDTTQEGGSGHAAGGLEPVDQGTTTEPGCYGLAPVLKESDDKSDYNFVISVIFCFSLLL
jgi:hypothetical protein